MVIKRARRRLLRHVASEKSGQDALQSEDGEKYKTFSFIIPLTHAVAKPFPQLFDKLCSGGRLLQSYGSDDVTA